jgi:hypothetical protein
MKGVRLKELEEELERLQKRLEDVLVFPPPSKFERDLVISSTVEEIKRIKKEIEEERFK